MKGMKALIKGVRCLKPLVWKCFWGPTPLIKVVSLHSLHFGKDQKGIYKRGIHDQGDFWKFLLEIAV